MNIKKIISYSLVGSMLSYMVFLGNEGLIANADTATSTSTSTLPIAVTLNVTTEIDLSCPNSVALSAISGLTGGTSSNTADCNVKTNSSGGYTLLVHASTTPALKSGSNFFSDYRTASPEYTFTNPSTASSSFGFSASSTDASAFKSSSGTCGSGSTDYTHCFRSFVGTGDVTVSTSVAPTAASGTTTTLNFEAQVGNTAMQAYGNYTANVTVTAVAQ